jgi:hypothetical protein
MTKFFIYGLIAGAISIAISSFLYVTKPPMYVGSMTRTLLEIGVYLPFMYLSARQAARAATDFKDIMRAAFVTFLVANLLAHGMEYYMYNYYDLKLADYQKDMWVKIYVQKDITNYNETVANVREGSYHTIAHTARTYAKAAIAGFGFSALMTYIVNKLDA